MTSSRTGNALAALSFVLWGILPLYYHFLPAADTSELLAFRIIFSVPTMYLVMKCLRHPIPSLATILADKKSLFICLLASLIMSVSWYAFTWALTNGQVLAASLGFFINPLFVIALGVLFLGDRLNRGQLIAVVFGIAGLAVQIWHYGELPWLSLIMGGFFALFGLCKKWIKYDAFVSVTVEAILLTPIALLYMGWQIYTGNSDAVSHDVTTFALYAGAAPVTLMPLVLFTLAVRKTSLTMVGIMQYIEPTLQFCLALFIFGEAFDSVKALSFALIWVGIIACSIDGWRSYKKSKFIPVTQ